MTKNRITGPEVLAAAFVSVKPAYCLWERDEMVFLLLYSGKVKTNQGQ